MAGGKGGTLHLFTPFEVFDRGDVLESGALRQVREAAPTQEGLTVLSCFFFCHLYLTVPRGALQSPSTSHLELVSDCALMGVGGCEDTGGMRGGVDSVSSWRCCLWFLSA